MGRRATSNLVVRRNGTALYVAGELDCDGAVTLAAEVHKVLDQGQRDIAMNLADVTFLDSTGLRALLACQVVAKTRGVLLTVVEPSSAVDRLLELAGVRARLV
jgi:stage II sporulation protein AA (anti-sigma F factor antagonist)